jgi:hypothetical protein
VCGLERACYISLFVIDQACFGSCVAFDCGLWSESVMYICVCVLSWRMICATNVTVMVVVREPVNGSFVHKSE